MSLLGDIGIGLFGGSVEKSNRKSFISPDQLPFLLQQWQQAQNLAGQQQGQIGQTAFPLAQQLGQQGQGFLGGLGQNAGQQLSPFMQPGQHLGPQIAAMQQLGQFNLGQSLGQIGDQAVAAGGAGSARSGLAAGTAAGLSNIGFMGGVGDLMGQDVQRRQQAAMGQAGIQGQTALGGLGSLGSLFNLGMSPFQAQFNPLLNAGQLLGGPAILGEGSANAWGASGGAGDFLGGMMASDVRLKRNIVPLGGGWYEYEYIWGGGRRVGVMAQELMQTRPDAVFVMDNGYLAVDYGRL